MIIDGYIETIPTPYTGALWASVYVIYLRMKYLGITNVNIKHVQYLCLKVCIAIQRPRLGVAGQGGLLNILYYYYYYYYYYYIKKNIQNDRL